MRNVFLFLILFLTYKTAFACLGNHLDISLEYYGINAEIDFHYTMVEIKVFDENYEKVTRYNFKKQDRRHTRVFEANNTNKFYISFKDRSNNKKYIYNYTIHITSGRYKGRKIRINWTHNKYVKSKGLGIESYYPSPRNNAVITGSGC